MADPQVLVVKTPSLFKVDDTYQDERFMKVRVAVMHSGENLNRSSFTTSVIKDAKDTFANIPILANTIEYTDEDGNTVLDYGGHDMHLEEDKFKDGEYRIVYDEKVVGVVPETNNFEIVTDSESGKDFVYVDALIYREYGNYCADILEARNGSTSVSAEIYCDEISVNAQSQIMEVDKMRMSGVTLLGEDVTPAMTGANATVFSIKEDDRQTQLIEVMRELSESLANYTAAISGNEKSKEGGNNKMDKLTELLEKYGVTAEDITFDYADLSDEELEAKFEEVFSASDDADPEDGEPELESADEEGVDGEDADEEEDDDEDEAEDGVDSYSFTVVVDTGDTTRTFSVSLQEKINALSTLVNETYSDDDTWYAVDVYDDDKYVIMVDCWNSGKAYKQSYRVKKDTYTLTGDRVEVFARWLTNDEINALDRMKSDYAVLSEKLSKYEDEPKKMEILNSEDYSLIADNEEFISLKDEANHFDLTVEEVTKKADEILTNAAKAHKFSFSAPENKDGASVKPLPPTNKKVKRYGSLFDGIVK